MRKSVFSDPLFYFLIVLNAYFIYEYYLHPEIYPTIVWVFWCQSVLIGVFNFLELLTVRNIEAGAFKMNNEPVDLNKSRGCVAGFFLVHYGGFHLVYLFFIAVKVGFNNIDPLFFRLSLALLLANQVFTFFRHGQMYRLASPDLGYLFFLPYLRIVPMHLMIMAPALLNIQPAITFLVLKGIMDVIGYCLSRRTMQKTTPSLTIQ